MSSCPSQARSLWKACKGRRLQLLVRQSASRITSWRRTVQITAASAVAHVVHVVRSDLHQATRDLAVRKYHLMSNVQDI
jgi:hypothetical protein